MPTITKNLLIINVLFFFGTIVAGRYGIDLKHMLGLHFFMADDFHIYQFVTYMFMHGDFSHLFFNMFAVWMFGRVLEEYWGPKRFLFYYMVCGIGAGLVQELVQFISYEPMWASGSLVNTGERIVSAREFLDTVVTVGASGSVYGILLAFGVLFPNQQLFIIPFPFPIKAKYFVIGYAVIELVLGLSSPGDSIAHFAHLGGMLFGLVLILYWKKKKGNYDGNYYRY